MHGCNKVALADGAEEQRLWQRCITLRLGVDQFRIDQQRSRVCSVRHFRMRELRAQEEEPILRLLECFPIKMLDLAGLKHCGVERCAPQRVHAVTVDGMKLDRDRSFFAPATV